MNPLCPPWDTLESDRRFHGPNGFSVSVDLAGPVLMCARVSGIGRDGDMPSNPEEAEWVDRAAATVTGMNRSWATDWTFPREGLEKFTAALGPGVVHRSYRTSDGKLAGEVWSAVKEQGEMWFHLNWRASENFNPGDIQLRRNLHGVCEVTLNGHPDATDALAAVLGRPVKARFSQTVTQEELEKVARWALDRAPGNANYCSATVTLRANTSSAG